MNNNIPRYPESYTEYNARLTKVEGDSARHSEDIVDLKNTTKKLVTDIKENEKHISIVDKNLNVKFTKLETIIEENNKNHNQQFASISTKFDKMDQKFDTIIQNNLTNCNNVNENVSQNTTNTDWVIKLLMIIVTAIITGAITLFFKQ